jgi:hypothetical protein
MDKRQAEAANWQVAHSWAEGVDLVYAGVELGDVTTYSLLTVLGRIGLQHLAQLEAVPAVEGPPVDVAAAVALARAEAGAEAAQEETAVALSHGEASR